MAKFVLDFGMEVDMLTQEELDKSLDQAQETWYAKAAGADYVTRIANGINDGAGLATYQIQGPGQGYAWSVKMVAAALSASAQLQVFWDAQTTLPASNPTVAGTSGVVTWGSDQVVLKPGRSLYATASTGAIVSLLIAAWQIPAERLGLLR